jgi:hypothetical protein
LAELDYVRPKFLHDSSASTSVPLPVKIEPKDNTDLPSYASHYPKKPPTPPDPIYNLSTLLPPEYSISLKDLNKDKLIQRLYSLEHANNSDPGKATSAPVPLEFMSQDHIIRKLHQENSTLPHVRLCNTSNPSDTKPHLTAEEFHRITGCCRFRNYRHLLVASTDGTFINKGELLVFIGTYTTIPKASRGKPIDRTTAKFLDVVHIDIAFGDCLSIRGFKYAWIFVDRATRYNWCFGPKSLHSNEI